ncbi:MAG TPA: hypothetical protein VLS28_05255, partial [Candidatus Sulfomarinibacteraceae bacterium]|nr:hypothetical protein [Candidatus Sulfomarinibacteraceae bacterium]
MTGSDAEAQAAERPAAPPSGGRIRRLGLRARVAVIVLLVAAPLVAGNVLRLTIDREAARAAATDETERLATLVAGAAREYFAAARHALLAIAATPQVRDLDPAACTTYLQDL